MLANQVAGVNRNTHASSAVHTTGDAEAHGEPQRQARRFIEYLATYRRCSPATQSAYAADLRCFLEWWDATVPPPDLSRLDQRLLMRYVTGLAHLSANTIRRRLHGISSWSDFMVRQGLIAVNPVRGLPLPRRERKLPCFPSPDECRRLLAAARTPVERAAIWLLVCTGLRRAELIGLDTTDLVSDGTEIRVMGKGRRERLLPLPAKCQEVLRDYLIQRGEREGPLLLNRAGNRLGLTSLRRLFERLQHRTGVEGFTIHSMRHSYATMLVKAGVDLGTVRDLLGHSDLSVTSIYLHSDLRSKRLAVEQLPVLMIGGGEGE
ncbi:MAG: tyrosine-type recombinase/integrase [Armatimonadia bacterium]